MKRAFLISCFALFVAEGYSQVQQAWVKRYSLASSATNQATAIALARDGNLIVAGSSASTNGDLDYLVIKYAPNGQQLWQTRYDSPTNAADRLRGMSLGTNGNVVLTGTSKTVQLDSDGNVLWIAPYGGRAVAADSDGNVYVTGYSELDFATAKLNGSNGTSLWMRTYTYYTSTNYPDVSQAIAIGANGTVAVAGFETWNVDRSGVYRRPRTIAYDSTGNQLWSDGTAFNNYWLDVTSVFVETGGHVLIMFNNPMDALCFITRRFDANGVLKWTWLLDTDSSIGYSGNCRAMVVDNVGTVYLTGSRLYGEACCTVQLGTNGHKVWLSTYHGPGSGQNQGNAIALDSLGNVYVTGFSPGNGTGNDIVTLKYDHNGNQLWVQRYDGPAHGDDIATGIVVDNQANVYVTGYSATTNGGTEFVTIKYAQLTNIQKKTDGSIQLQFFGTPGSNYGFQATTNFLEWTNLGLVSADTNSVFQFCDTNAPFFPYRFYRYYFP